MNRNTGRNVSQGTLRQLKGKIKEQWARLNEDEIDELVGRNEQLAGKLQERYGWEKDEARRQVDEFYRRHRRLH
ncbi:MAG: CsbD family protein [Steroidobacteraceae bacterium]